MRNFQSITFLWKQTYREIFKSVLVYLLLFLFVFSFYYSFLAVAHFFKSFFHFQIYYNIYMYTWWMKVKIEVCLLLTAWKVSRCGVFSGPYFPVFGLNTERYRVEIQSISPYSVRIRENADQNKLRIWTLFTQFLSNK